MISKKKKKLFSEVSLFNLFFLSLPIIELWITMIDCANDR